MKFEQKLDANKHSDWPYIDYKGLKKVMKKVIKGFLNTSSKSGSQPASVAASPSAKRAGSAMDALCAPLLRDAGLLLAGRCEREGPAGT